MSEENIEPSEIDSLKQIADNMGIKYSPNIGLDKLKAKIEEAREVATPVAVVNSTSSRYRAAKMDATKLVRVRVVNMDPNHKDHKGVWAMGANKAVGTLRKFVPFSVEYHLENMLFKILRDKKRRETYEIPDGKGGKVKKNRFVPCFAIEELPPLTPEELEALASDQRKRGAIEED